MVFPVSCLTRYNWTPCVETALVSTGASFHHLSSQHSWNLISSCVQTMVAVQTLGQTIARGSSLVNLAGLLRRPRMTADTSRLSSPLLSSPSMVHGALLWVCGCSPTQGTTGCCKHSICFVVLKTDNNARLISYTRTQSLNQICM